MVVVSGGLVVSDGSVGSDGLSPHKAPHGSDQYQSSSGYESQWAMVGLSLFLLYWYQHRDGSLVLVSDGGHHMSNAIGSHQHRVTARAMMGLSLFLLYWWYQQPQGDGLIVFSHGGHHLSNAIGSHQHHHHRVTAGQHGLVMRRRAITITTTTIIIGKHHHLNINRPASTPPPT